MSGAKRDPEPLLVLAAMALEVAASAPERFNKYGSTSYVPRELITRIRTYAEQHGRRAALDRPVPGAHAERGRDSPALG